MSKRHDMTAYVPESLAGQRLDQVLARLFPAYSRSRLQQWLKTGQVSVDGGRWRARDKVRGGEQIAVAATMAEEVPWQGEAMALDVLYDDGAILVVNKPPGQVVHPAAGNASGTLVNALLHYAPALSEVPRAGVVHRLDKDTSGLLVMARELTAHKRLVAQLQARTMGRVYDAVVTGRLIAGGSVEAPIGRHPVDRKRMAVVQAGKPAVTHYRVKERFRGHSWIQASLETGRTHQIRVHMAHIRHPLVGDQVYSGRPKLPKGAGDELIHSLRGLARQALHATQLTLVHPYSGEPMTWTSPLPEDMAALLGALRKDAGDYEGGP